MVAICGHWSVKDVTMVIFAENIKVLTIKFAENTKKFEYGADRDALLIDQENTHDKSKIVSCTRSMLQQCCTMQMVAGQSRSS